ncbi:MAG: DUF362 domain-containing protein [Deltaproteobacteria bacterium]|nr:DUF362 domain-containing protein [Deltaproteobacteria bacterium]
MIEKRTITRRDFMRTGSYLAVGGLMGLPLVSDARAGKAPMSRVVLIRDEEVLDEDGRPREDRLLSMLDMAVKALFDNGDSLSAWRNVAGAKDIVGVKSNVWYYLPTPRELESAILERLTETGVREHNISFDDRGVRGNPVFQQSTVLINVRPMRTHHWSGLGTLIKNYIMFVSWPFRYHGNACENLGAIWRKSNIKGKTRLNILVMLTPLFHGIGPHHFSRKYTWPYCGLIVSRDPVAADATGARIIQAKRDDFFGERSPISPPPIHIVAADRKFKLGNSNPDRIELIKLGWDKDVLI